MNLQPLGTTADAVESADGAQDGTASLHFCCFVCGFVSHADYCGRKPPFNKHIVYLEDVFVIRDPLCVLPIHSFAPCMAVWH